MTEFNINDAVIFNLSTYGETCPGLKGDLSCYKENNPCRVDYLRYKMSLWRFVQVLAPHMNMGLPTVIRDNIITFKREERG